MRAAKNLKDLFELLTYALRELYSLDRAFDMSDEDPFPGNHDMWWKDVAHLERSYRSDLYLC